jgi:hypothetical protein
LIAEDQNGFKARVIGKVRAGLPRKPPGRRGSPEIQKAAEIYIRDYKLRDKEGNWREIGKQASHTGVCEADSFDATAPPNQLESQWA